MSCGRTTYERQSRVSPVRAWLWRSGPTEWQVRIPTEIERRGRRDGPLPRGDHIVGEIDESTASS
jgi:hypothetical protein